MKKKITTLLMVVLLCLIFSGCGKSNGYEGAGMKIKYNTSDWSIFYREANENTNVIELYSDKGGGLSIMSCEADPGSAEEIYQGAKLGYIIGRINFRMTDIRKRSRYTGG